MSDTANATTTELKAELGEWAAAEHRRRPFCPRAPTRRRLRRRRAAGLLRGYKATTHWAHRDLLPLVGAKPVAARVVEDRNRITGGGVTSGIDFGLPLLARLAGEDNARGWQLGTAYDPRSPFDAGTPATAGAFI